MSSIGRCTGPRGNVLTNDQVIHVEAQMYSGKGGDVAGHAASWLSRHHYLYSLAYQPHARFWVFQLGAIALLVAVSAVLVLLTARVIERRRA